MKLSSFLKPGAAVLVAAALTAPSMAQETAAPEAVPAHTVFILNTLLFVIAGFLVKNCHGIITSFQAAVSIQQFNTIDLKASQTVFSSHIETAIGLSRQLILI